MMGGEEDDGERVVLVDGEIIRKPRWPNRVKSREEQHKRDHGTPWIFPIKPGCRKAHNPSVFAPYMLFPILSPKADMSTFCSSP